MEPMEGAIDELGFVTKSCNRVRILQWIAEEEHLKRATLKQRADVARTTLQRNLDALEERGWLRRDGRTYALTTKGETITAELLPLVATVDVADRLAPFLDCVADGDLDLPLRWLADADLTVADAGNPYAPVNVHIMAMKAADQFRCLLPSVGLQPMGIVRDCVARGCTHEVIFGPEAAATVRADPAYDEAITDLLAADSCTLLASDDKPPFYLGVADDTVQIGVEDEGKPHALVEMTDSRVRAWADDTYADYRQRAEPFSFEPPVAP